MFGLDAAVWGDESQAGCQGEDQSPMVSEQARGQVCEAGVESRKLGVEVVNEYKLEMHCSDEYADQLVEVISRVARTGQVTAGWVYVIDIAKAFRVG